MFYEYVLKYDYFHVYWGCDYYAGFGLNIEFIDPFNTQLVNTNNYNTIASFHTKIIRIRYVPSVFTSRILATDL
jgi:hypothetical protein